MAKKKLTEKAWKAECQNAYNNGFASGQQNGVWEGEVQGKNKAAQEYRKQRSEDRQVALTRVLEAYTQMMTAVATSITTIAGEFPKQ